MKHSFRIFLCIAFFANMAVVLSQDLIVQTNGGKIYCRIVDEDSVSLFYLRKPQKTRFEIKKTEVERYEIADRFSARKLTQNTSQDTVQQKPELAVLSFFGSLAIPLSGFGSSSAFDQSAGFAKAGAFFRTALTFKIIRYFGVSVSYCYQVHAYNTSSLDNQLTQTINIPSLNLHSNIISHSRAGSWRMQGFYAGLYGMLPVKHSKLAFDLDLSAGYTLYTLPELNQQLSINGIAANSTRNTSEKRTLGLIASLAASYKLSQLVTANLGLCFFHGSPTFHNVSTSINNGQPALADLSQTISSLNIQAGLSFLLH